MDGTLQRRVTQVLFVACVVADGVWLLLLPHLHRGGHWAPMLTAVALQLALLAAERRAPALSRRAVLGAGLGLAALCLVVPAQGSHDVWSYSMYGRMVGTYHVSPYSHVPDDFPHDPLLHHVDRAWRNTPSVYGPLFNAVSGVGALVYGGSATLARGFYQLLASAALGGVLLLLYRRGIDAWGLALVGLAPTMLSSVNGAHNDIIVGLACLGGLLLLQDDRPLAAGVAIGAGTLVKLLGAPVAGGAVVALLLARRWREAVRVGGGFAATVVVGYLAAGGTHAIQPLSNASRQISRASLMSNLHWVLYQWGGSGALGFTAHADLRTRVASAAGAVAFGIYLWLRRRRPEPVEVAIAALLLYLLTADYVLPWYLTALLPLLPLASKRLRLLGFAFVVLMQVVYVGGTTGVYRRIPFAETITHLSAPVTLALLILVVWVAPGRVPRRPSRPASS